MVARTGVHRRRALARIVAAVAAVIAAVAVALLGGTLAARDARADADDDLHALAAAAAAAFRSETRALAPEARRLAANPAVARALARGDEAVLARLARAAPGVSFTVGGRTVGETTPVRRSALVLSPEGEPLGQVHAGLAFDTQLADRLAAAAGAVPPDDIALVEGPRRYGAPRVDGMRLVALPLLRGRPDIAVVATTPTAGIDEAADERRRRVFLATLVSLLTVFAAVGAAALWRADGRRAARLGAIERDRASVREALSLVGDALAATHDAEALLPVILQTTAEAAGATEGRLLRGGLEVTRVGRRSASKEPLSLPLGEDDEGQALEIQLYTPGGAFDPHARELAAWFVGQAAIALENARLHGIVRRQAVTDDLTGLANRRQFVAALEAELTRAERFGTDLAVVIADLDDFKGVNDRFGHEFGNEVLRRFAEHLTAFTRDVDVAARLGGEEFALLLPQTDAGGAAVLAERFRESLAKVPVTAADGTTVKMKASFGVAAYPATATADDLLRVADDALYRAKAAGKDRVIVQR